MENQGEGELAAWLAFDRLSNVGLGSRKIIALRQHFGDLSLAWKAQAWELAATKCLPPDVLYKFLEARGDVHPEEAIETLDKLRITAIPISSPDYPEQLRQIHDPPCVLYIRGELRADDLTKAIGVVGTRRPSAYGQRLAKELSRDLAQAGVTVVSGMAIGIDSLAHRGALEGGGRTIAVLGCGADICYPSSNRPLYDLLSKGGAGRLFPNSSPAASRSPGASRRATGSSPDLLRERS